MASVNFLHCLRIIRKTVRSTLASRRTKRTQKNGARQLNRVESVCIEYDVLIMELKAETKKITLCKGRGREGTEGFLSGRKETWEGRMFLTLGTSQAEDLRALNYLYYARAVTHTLLIHHV